MRLPWEQHLVFSLKKKVLQTASRINSTLSRSFSAPVALNKQNDGFDHGVGHPLLLLYDAKVPLGKNSNYFNGLGHDLSNLSVSLF